MVENAAYEYSKYFQKSNFENEIKPLCENINHLSVRLDEFEFILSNIKSDSNEIIKQNMSQILSCSDEFNDMCNRIDNLDKLMNIIKENLDKMEETVDIAEKELDVSNYTTFKGLLKPLFGIPKNYASSSYEKSNVNDEKSNLENGKFKRQQVFKTSDYFENDIPDISSEIS